MYGMKGVCVAMVLGWLAAVLARIVAPGSWPVAVAFGLGGLAVLLALLARDRRVQSRRRRVLEQMYAQIRAEQRRGDGSTG